MQILSWMFLLCATVFANNPLPIKTYISRPFICQAPYGDWSEPWQNACEETAIIMALQRWRGDKLEHKTVAQEIVNLVRFQEKHYGGHYDLTAQQMVQLMRDYYKDVRVEVLYDVSVDDIKKILAKKKVIIVPLAGKLLHNPYFTPPGPAYHCVVLKGYDDRKQEFITHDPGTKHGCDYRYNYMILYNAIHDWTGAKSTIQQGRKAVVII